MRHDPGPPDGPSDGVAPASADLSLFGFLWAFALLYHQVGYGLATLSPLNVALTFAAVLTMLRPRSVPALAALGLLHAALVVRTLPDVTNHWFFGGVVSLALCLSCIAVWGFHRSPHGPGALLERFAPSARICVVLVYALSGFHKLNTDFLRPGVSCASVLTGKVHAALGLPGGLAIPDSALIGLTLTVELGLPLLLLVPRTRLAGVVLALGFHAVMALAGYPRFSATGVALLSLFLPASASSFPSRGFECSPTGGWIRAAAVGTLLVAAVAGPAWSTNTYLAFQFGLAGIVLVAVAGCWRRRAALPPLLSASGLRDPLLAAPVLLILAASQPYLGLATDRALGMYSNLRTEGGRSNHLLIPAAWQVFPYQRDLVAVVATGAPALQELAERRMLVPYEELRARLTLALRGGGEDFALTYRRAGQERTIPSVVQDSGLALPVSRAQWMVFRFRPIEAEGPRACTI